MILHCPFVTNGECKHSGLCVCESNRTKPHFRIVWSHNYFYNSWEAAINPNCKPLLGYYIVEAEKWYSYKPGDVSPLQGLKLFEL